MVSGAHVVWLAAFPYHLKYKESGSYLYCKQQEGGLRRRLVSENLSQSPLSPHRAVEMARASGEHLFNPGDFVLKAPIYNPQKLICIGMNYVDHCTEQNIPVPKEPIIFSKFNSAITEPNGAVVLPEETQVRVVVLHDQSHHNHTIITT